MIIKEPGPNPLGEFFELFPSRDPTALTHVKAEAIKILFNKAGVVCESYEEVYACLKLLNQMNLISLATVEAAGGHALLIGNLYNGK
jgi:hypothetical protein